jgi:hypothetical protein
MNVVFLSGSVLDGVVITGKAKSDGSDINLKAERS